MLTEDKITEIFVIADEFCKVLIQRCSVAEVSSKIRTDRKREYHRDCRLS